MSCAQFTFFPKGGSIGGYQTPVLRDQLEFEKKIYKNIINSIMKNYNPTHLSIAEMTEYFEHFPKNLPYHELVMAFSNKQTQYPVRTSPPLDSRPDLPTPVPSMPC
eukprot:TRINITY_DN114259_c0_g1_i1.p1 TRINITY_DN114259_c0_g1~~TRINITY_DN114259_c0_g1_i1.p1  ORF type:complete len:113 (-),score=9.75 TRINITY_DN114259_c0_g1_i1:23-340(-)